MPELMKEKEMDRMWVFFAPIFLGLLSVDQLTKWWALQNVPNKIDNMFGFELSFNEGIAFGIDLPKVLIMLISVGILVFFAYLIYHYKIWRNKIHLFAAAVLLAGGIGNSIDRLRFGYVVDFIKVYWWPTFNVADVLIVIGVALFAWEFFINEDALSEL